VIGTRKNEEVAQRWSKVFKYAGRICKQGVLRSAALSASRRDAMLFLLGRSLLKCDAARQYWTTLMSVLRTIAVS